MKINILTSILPFAVCGCATVHTGGSFSETPKPASYESVSYKKLQSPTFNADYNQKGVRFNAMYRGEWTELGVYIGLDSKGKIYLNHRDTDYTTTAGPFNATSDSEIPPFILSIPKEKADFIYSLKPGTIITIEGRAAHRGGWGADYAKFKVDADSVTIAK